MKRGKQSDAYMAKTQTEDFRERMRIILIGVLLISFYGTGFLEAVFAGKHNSFFPGAVFTSFFTNTISLLIFPLLICALTGIALYTVNKTWGEAQREDKLQRGFLHSKGSSPYGDAHFEEPWEFVDAAQVRPAEACKGKILGQLDDAGKMCVDFNPYEGRINSHMVAIGRSGGGKTFTFVKSFVMQAMKERHSLFIADPKGDLYRETSSYFRDNGYIVRKLDLKNLEKSDGWHCLGSLHGKNLITNTQIFSSTVMANISERDDVYSRAGGSLLSALILRVLQGQEYPPEKKNIKTVHELLQNPGGIDFLDTLLSNENVTSSEDACTRFYMDFKRASGNLAGNIITHLATGLQLLNSELLSEILSTDNIDLAQAGVYPSAIFLNFSDTDTTFRFILSLFFSMAFINLVDYADIHTKNGKLPVPVDFLLDEFPALGVIPDWDRKIATVRSRQINCVMIIQDVPQLKKRYLESWMTILNNCGCLLTLGINEPEETAPYISKRIGETSIEVISRSESKFMGKKDPFVSKQSTGIGKREFLSPAEICELSRDGSLILFADHQPVYANKFPYILHPDADKLEDTLPEDVVDFTDREGRKQFREMEEAYRTLFWETHTMFPDMRYSDLSDALMTDRPEDPMSMFAAMIRDDFFTAQNAIIRKLKGSWEKLDDATVKEDKTKKQKYELDRSAEKGAFKKFCENYNATVIQQYNDLSVEFDMMTGEVLSIKDSSDERQAPREEATKEDKSSEREVKTDNTPSDQSNYADTGNPAIYFDPFKPSSGGNMPPKKSRTD